MSFFDELKRRNVVRVAIAYVMLSWLIIQVVETIFPAFGFGDAVVRMTTIGLAVGLLPALMIAWIFEWTPEGLKRDHVVDRARPINPQAGRNLDRVIMVSLTLALGYFALDKFALEPQREAASALQKFTELEQARQHGRTEALIESFGDQSIAVLPFVNLSSDPEQEYFSDGLAEELLNLLARVPGLRVISRSSAFATRGQNLATPEIARRLNVAHVLEGSVRKAGDRVRVTTQLVEARSDTHLWSETYERPLDDIFALQDEIAAEVAGQLKLTLMSPVPAARRTNPEAYTLALKARHLGRLVTAEAYEQSNALYERALAVDPEYAVAWNGLARNVINQTSKGLVPYEAGYARAHEAAERALEIDPDLPAAHASLGLIATLFDNDLAGAAGHLQRALVLNPANTDIIANAATLMLSLGRAKESVALDEYFTIREPLSSTGHYNLGNSYLAAGHWDDAVVAYQTALQLSPDRIGVYYYIGIALLLKGEADAALEAIEREPLEVIRLAALAMAHHALDQESDADSAQAQLIADFEQDAAYNIACVLAYRGATDNAFEWLGRAVAYADPGLVDITWEPLLARLHDDARWLPLLESIGKSPQQLSAIRFDVALP